MLIWFECYVIFFGKSTLLVYVTLYVIAEVVSMSVRMMGLLVAQVGKMLLDRILNSRVKYSHHKKMMTKKLGEIL